MSQVKRYAQRLLNPFHGVMQVIAIEHAEAESTDGINWILYVSHEDIVSHTGMSEIRYGSWNQQDGLQLSRVRGTETSNIIDMVGEKIAAAVEKYASTIPFPLNDRYECWLLTEDGEPLALLDTVDSYDKQRSHDRTIWHPGTKAYEEFHSDFGDAGRLKQLINQRAGERSRTLWVERKKTDFGYSGDAIKDKEVTIAAANIPQRLLLEDWQTVEDSRLVADYLAWLAPWLLQLNNYDDDKRQMIEQQAWKRPMLCAKQYHLFAKVLDEKQLKVTRVQARLMGYDGQGQKVIETFIHTGDKETYSP
ncbi:MAG: hypothetical protein HKP22_12905 [Gammaproteobacteria bacterium]|nr:hypothetical protein [Gammaproteobacteria bacterium]